MVRRHCNLPAVMCVLMLPLLVVRPAIGQEAESDDGITWWQIGLAGVTADIPHGNALGERCFWYVDSQEATKGCWISVGTLDRAGLPMVEGREIDLSYGAFGTERYRLAGRITGIEFRRTILAPSPWPRQDRRMESVAQPREPLIDEQGRTVGYRKPQSNDIWRGVRPTPNRLLIRMQVEWVLYDSETSTMVARAEENGSSFTYADALYESMQNFMEDMVDE